MNSWIKMIFPFQVRNRLIEWMQYLCVMIFDIEIMEIVKKANMNVMMKC